MTGWKMVLTAALVVAATAPLVALDDDNRLKRVVMLQANGDVDAERIHVLSSGDNSAVLRGLTLFGGGDEHANGLQYYLQASPEGSFGISISDTDGELTVELNGESISEDRIRRDGDQVEILDQGGEVLFRFNALDSQRFSIPLRGLWHDRLELRNESEPRPLIGIYMETVSKALAHQLDLPEDAVVVHDVLDGFAAQRAGLEQFDIITHVDGEPGVTMASLREAISDRKEGDVVDLRVIRKGEVRDIPINVEIRRVPSWRHLPGSGGLEFEELEELELEGFVDPRGEVLRRMFQPRQTEEADEQDPATTAARRRVEVRVRKNTEANAETTLEELEKRIQELEHMLKELDDQDH